MFRVCRTLYTQSTYRNANKHEYIPTMYEFRANFDKNSPTFRKLAL